MSSIRRRLVGSVSPPPIRLIYVGGRKRGERNGAVRCQEMEALAGRDGDSLLLFLVSLVPGASGAGGIQAPYFNSPYADRPVEPTRFSPSNIEQFSPG